MLRQGQPVFLDDMTLEQVQAELRVPIRIVHGAADIVAAVLGELPKTTCSAKLRCCCADCCGLLLIAGVLPVCFADVVRAQGSVEAASVDGSEL